MIAATTETAIMQRETILITSPLEAEHVARIAAFAPDRVEVMYEPGLLATTRYRNDHKGEPLTRTPEQQARWEALLPRTTIAFDLPSAAELAVMPKLRWIQTTSTGVGQAVAKLGLIDSPIIVTTARGVHAQPLAEFVFMALLAHFRQLDYLRAEQRAHRWLRVCGQEIAGRVLVILGAGDLARGSARIAKALDMHVIAIARNPAQSRDHGALFDEVLPVSALHQALGRADAAVLTVPHTPETERMIDAAAIAAMKPGIALVNIARGQVVDEIAMIDALRRGHIGFAALDVTEVEPLPAESPLWDMPNVLISPHSASTVDGENGRITDIFLHNLGLWLEGRPEAMRNLLDKPRLY
jgi:phosphoglycerate dehydrogenase-like enzyme